MLSIVWYPHTRYFVLYDPQDGPSLAASNGGSRAPSLGQPTLHLCDPGLGPASSARQREFTQD